MVRVVYTSTSELKPLRTPPSDAEQTELIDRFYEPHHRELEANVAAALASNCECVDSLFSMNFSLIDVHLDLLVHHLDR
jgi:hypothetical protein